MSRKQTLGQQWEQVLVDDYYDYRWRQVLDPLYERFQRWKTGELPHREMDHAIHEVQKKSQDLFSLFSQKRSWLARAIQMDRNWFEPWVASHPPPPGVDLLPKI